MERILQACLSSWNGLASAARSDAAVREELLLLALSVPAAMFVGVNAERRLQLVLVVLIVLAVELLNTAVEKLADRVTLETDPQIRRVKNVGSAAVLFALVIAGLAWALAIAERFLSV